MLATRSLVTIAKVAIDVPSHNFTITVAFTCICMLLHLCSSSLKVNSTKYPLLRAATHFPLKPVAFS
jgi:hypothetical protein